MNVIINSRTGKYVAAGIIVVAVAIAYANSINNPFVFDDRPSTVDNASIRRLWPIDRVLLPPGNYAAVQRRPVINLSLAINYAISGDHTWSYHLMNVAAHALAALLLFGIVHRTLRLPRLVERFGKAATPLAATVALLWAVHPLLTDAVTYVIQRTEVFAGLFYLLALYCTLRGDSARRPRRWYAAAVAACVLGVGCKEVVLTAPFVIMLYDRVFLSSSWREAFRRRGGLYLWLGVSWIVYVSFLPYGAEGTEVFGEDLAVVEYLMAQGGAIAHYLKLCFWPDPLVFDYGFYLPETAWEIIPFVVLIGVLLAVVIDAFRYRPDLGFLGAWFFVILAPSSSFIPLLQQPIAEKRMYLPLAAVVTFVVLGVFAVGEWLMRRKQFSPRTLRVAAGASVALAAAAFIVLTIDRNRDYRSNLAIWEDTVAKAPNNARAHENLGLALAGRGRFDEAIWHYRRSLDIIPNWAAAYNDLGNIYMYRGRLDLAVEYYNETLKLSPKNASAHNNLGNVLLAVGRTNEAVNHYYKALACNYDCETTYNNLGSALAKRGQVEEAIAFFRRAVQLNPSFADAHNNLGRALAGQGWLDEAIVHFRASLELKPHDSSARRNLHRALAQKRAGMPLTSEVGQN
ncbi:MAG: tetratricopeptide repeat protein [Pirellulales bacterium]|nr:tetratricopeptide repeat protein [Pirellulales bacterium]